MTRLATALSVLLLACGLGASTAATAQVTGLSGWSLYLDPGHSGTDENVGVFGYAEPQKVLRVGLALKEMLETRTDIEAVYISRTSDADQVGLSQRSDEANALGVDFFHSIHSNAGAPSTNNTLMLYGGWRLNGATVEKTPTGGGRMGDEYVEALTAAMRIPTIGNYADRTFYQGFPDTHDNQYPYLSVNRRTTMASVLSEGGFHTNPRQNTLNMNADWKRLEAQAHYWAILDWHGVERSTHRIATGIVTDVETGRPLNGATVEIDGQTYTTDTYESLFNAYSNDPDQLSNGFYYLEDLGAGTHTVTASAPDFGTVTAEITMNDTTFTFLDLALTSTVPPVVTASYPDAGAEAFRITDALTVTFSRPMDPSTTVPAVSLVPAGGGDAVAGTATVSGQTLTFRPSTALDPLSDYRLTVSEAATTTTGDGLDGDGDGVAGDPFVTTFTTGFADTAAPRLVSSFPAPNADDVEVRPVLTVVFDEVVDPATLEGRVRLTTASGGLMPSRFTSAVVGEQTTVSLVPDEALDPDAAYVLVFSEGVQDAFLNPTTGPYRVPFRTGVFALTPTVIDDFEGSSVADDWWAPQQSGSTVGIVTDSTSALASDQANLLGGTGALAVDYGWDTAASDHLIRVCFDGCDSNAVSFDASATLQAYVFGDGNGTLLRFAVDDASSTEVSPWVAVDWIGWRPVTWDLSADGTGDWIGNGVLDGALTFESLQLGYAPGAPAFGTVVVDDLRLVEAVSVDGEDGPDAAAFAVGPPRPNPARGPVAIPLRLASPTVVTARVFNALGQQVATLAEGVRVEAARHVLTWETTGVAPGVYLVRVEGGDLVSTQRVVVVR